MYYYYSGSGVKSAQQLSEWTATVSRVDIVTRQAQLKVQYYQIDVDISDSFGSLSLHP